MNQVCLGLALFLLLNLAVGLVRVFRGPTPADRMLSAQLFSTTGVAILLLLSYGMENPALRDIALVFVLLSILPVVAFGKRIGLGSQTGEEDDEPDEP
jgi:multicomponent Na+:H+ antiporter subunit F